MARFKSSKEFSKDINKLFLHQKRRILKLLPCAKVKHIGSTSLPNILTKGDSDVLVAIPTKNFEMAVHKLKRVYQIIDIHIFGVYARSMKKDSKQKSQRSISYGMCVLCKASSIPKRLMIKHLEQCPGRITSVGGGKTVFHLMAGFPYDPRYWIHFEAPESVGLRTIDGFLRDIWLECCGHMSSFTIAGERYVAPSQGAMREYGDHPMNAKLADVLLPGMRFLHEYDFGSTTELFVDVIARGVPKAKSGPVRLLARNDPPDIRCYACNRSATTICGECEEEIAEPKDIASRYFCDRCIDDRAKHPHDDENMRMPVVNSPRMGVCGYTG